MQKYVAEKFEQVQLAITQGFQQHVGTNTKCQQASLCPRQEDISQKARILPDGIKAPTSIYECAMLAWMFEDEESRRLRQEENKAWEEIHKVEEEYNRRMIHMSGFEW